MKLLNYLRFLRPLRSLIVVALYTGIGGWGFGQSFFHLDRQTAWLIALAVALPLLLGTFIAGAAHEPMHRSFALLLPGLRERQRESATVSVLVAALATTCVAAWALPSVSPLAIFGLACALISFPCIDRHRVVGGLGSGLTSVLIWLLMCLAVGPKLAPALSAFPWIFLLGGLGIGATCLIRGFSRESLRTRAHTLFIAYQTNFYSYLFHRGMLARWQAELVARKNEARRDGPVTGRDWKIRAVGPTSFDWMQVIWHAHFGGRKRSSFYQVQMTFVFITLINAVVFSGIDSANNHLPFWANLARLADPRIGDDILSALLHSGMIVLCASALPLQRLSYPISRARLAQIEFWQIITQLATAMAVITAAILLASVVGQFASGKFSSGYGLPALLATDLLLAVLLPFLFTVSKLKRPSLRIAAGIPAIGAIMLASFIGPRSISLLFTLPGILLWLIAAGFSQWVLWHRLQRHYATTDLVVGGAGRTTPFGLGSIPQR